MCAEGDSDTFGESRTCGVCAMFVCWPAVIKMQQAAAQIVVAAVVSALISLNMQITCTGLLLVLLPPPPPSHASTKPYHHPLYPVIASANTLTNVPLTEFKHLSLCRGPGTRCAMFSLAVGICLAGCHYDENCARKYLITSVAQCGTNVHQRKFLSTHTVRKIMVIGQIGFINLKISQNSIIDF